MGSTHRVRFRRSPHLVCYWRGEQLVFANYATDTCITAEPLTCTILNFFDRWRSPQGLMRWLNGFDPTSVRQAITALARHSLLQQSDRPPPPAERAMQTWEHWNPVAAFFHSSTKDVPFTTDPADELRFLRERARKRPLPVPVKRYPGARRVPLPPPRTEGEFPRVLLARRTWRRFSPRPMDLSELATLLGLTWGVQHWYEVPGVGRLALKTSPSGGALHPIEVYVLALRVAGLPRGVYHYAADAHCLERLKLGASARQVVSFLGSQWWFGAAAAVMLMTAVFARTQWKYPIPRAYRVVLAEAGHLCQTFCLAATWLGLAPFCTMALADTRIEKVLGVDGVTESVLYAAGVGSRRPGEEWSPVPERPRRA